MHTGKDYWMNYMEKWFGKELIDKWKAYVSIQIIESNGKNIHLEIYDTGNLEAPTIIFAHGIAGYARVLLPFIIPLFEKGYNLVVPDLQGYGYNDGLKGDFEWNAHKQNLKDTVLFSRNKFKGIIVLGGASMGGPLAYAAGCESKDVDALVCWCLWDFNDSEFMIKETNTKKLTYVLIPIFKFISSFMGAFRLKTYKLISYDTLTSSPEFNQMVKQDPQAGTQITLKGAASLVLQSKPLIKHENYKKPVLVVQPENDLMTPKVYTKKVFCKLGSSNKKYVEIENAAHFPLEKQAYDIWTHEVDSFIKNLF